MWEVYDYKAAQEVGDAFTYRSDRTLREYDCSNEQTRRLSVKVYSENMGNGALLVGYDDPSQWTHNQPASGVEHLWKIVCGKQ